ncbi:AroM family protein [Polaromonas sp. UC242_47]|uniref:AroM family protein n=1 Tax=Polaromonas sp. UC242_47 TaxID=3374626 RepID=UPI00379F086B
MRTTSQGHRRIAFFTIGESPRSDVVPEMARHLGQHVQIDEYGALDTLDAAARQALSPRAGAHRFATRLRDGGSIELDKESTEARLAHIMREADTQGYDLLVPLCTGTAIPALQTLVIEPQQVVDQTMAALAHHCRRIGVMVPLAAQLETFHLAQTLPCELRLAHASPYESNPSRAAEALARAGRELADCDLIVMHCMGYAQAMRDAVADASARPVLLSNRIVAHTLAQLLE